MHTRRPLRTDDDVRALLAAALKHEWAVSVEYVVHAYSIPKGRYFYDDPILKQKADVRGQTIQIGIDEMYHALQLGVILNQMGVPPSFETDEIVRFPRIIDNIRRNERTEMKVTELYQTAGLEPGAYPLTENMVWNISADEVRHTAQFKAMAEALEADGNAGAPGLPASAERDSREDLRLLHDLCRLENELTHRYLKSVILFSGHQDLTQRLFKNSVNHMRHWDKLSGLLIKLGDVIAVENAARDEAGVERSTRPMPVDYPGEGRLGALESLLPAEESLVTAYEKAAEIAPPGDVQSQLKCHLALTREHVFTQKNLLANARKIKGLD